MLIRVQSGKNDLITFLQSNRLKYKKLVEFNQISKLLDCAQCKQRQKNSISTQPFSFDYSYQIDNLIYDNYNQFKHLTTSNKHRLLTYYKRIISMQQEPNQDPDLCRYTVIPIHNQEHREKLHKFITSRGKVKDKASLCRFYLRGICIMKAEYCKFAHSVKQLRLDEEQSAFYWKLSQKERKKRQFTEKKQFNQTALFILKNVKYNVLYDYQFSQRYKKSNLPVYDIDAISTDRGARIRIRQIMHRQNWDGFLDFLQKRYPNTNYPISFISFWYANFGFDKPQTRCKFGDFLKYSMFVRKYIQVDIIFPPNTFPSIFLVNSQSKHTILQQNIDQIYEKCMKQKQKQSHDKMEEFLEKALPEELSKKYICRYYMAGNCQQDADACLYSHSIQELEERYELDQQFPVEYRQPVMPIQVRMNYSSLYQATRQYPEYGQYSQQDINLNTTIRNQLRTRVHRKLFADFMEMLERLLLPRQNSHSSQTPQKNGDEEDKKQNKIQIFSVAIRDLQKYYQGAGFNHTNQNKFQHLEGTLWDLGFYMEDVIVKDQLTLEKKKVTYAYKIPPIQYLNSVYQQIIRICVKGQLQNVGEGGMILQSTLKRAVYSYPKQHVLPLHVYLRSRGVTFQDVVAECCSKQEISKIFFQSGEQNLKKLAQIIKKYIKKNKSYITKIDDIQSHIRVDKKQEVNTNHFISLRTQLQTAVLDMGKKIYYWPFDNNAYMIDPTHLPAYKKNIAEPLLKNMGKDESLQQFYSRCQVQAKQQGINMKKLNQLYQKMRIVVVDNWESLCYARYYLKGSGRLGVDLEGRLRVDGYVDLVQISALKKKNNEVQHKQIFVFDIYLMKKKQNEQKQLKKQNVSEETGIESSQGQQINSPTKVYNEAINLLKQLFECPAKLKILHDCRQDSVALRHILAINPVNIFDTSGYDVYLNQKQVYHHKYSNNYELLRKIYDVKVPGLNTILDTYKAPNGINVFKQSMKKKFGEQNNRSYFEMRPIDDQFLEYSARDVEDLVEVWQNMIGEDEQAISSFVGTLYSSN